MTESLHDPVMRDGEVLLAYDETVALDWLEQLTVYGQSAANDFLKAEVVRLAQTPGYAPCPDEPI